ncbi:MAG: RnfH family protein [Proteobacteria bacterium]|nr:RnfH family protein [Pseudomonadota bacterium]|tara:strand:+ start:368 stop:655 length:288 start_codon:yes stop_codon:yes gene_type:complete
MKITVIYAKPNCQRKVEIDIPYGATSHDAIVASSIESLWTDMDLNKCNIAIWGESVPKGYKLKDGDRIEICRQLNLDAKMLRRKRAKGGIKRARG